MSVTAMELPTFRTVQVQSWGAAKFLFGDLADFVFRGHSQVDWELSTSLERTASKLNAWPEAKDVESLILREFQRRAHHYLDNVPPVGECVEWLALIQHYGGPTRLLDFTHSPYVAAFFAMETAGTDAVVWGINQYALLRRAIETFNIDVSVDYLNINQQYLAVANQAICTKSLDPGMVLVEPHRLNQRMSTQQGTFLMPLELTHTFRENLLHTFGAQLDFSDNTTVEYTGRDPYALIDKPPLLKILLPREFHSEAMLDLAAMNVTSTSLFGGLEGFARSLPGTLRAIDKRYFRNEVMRKMFERPSGSS